MLFCVRQRCREVTAPIETRGHSRNRKTAVCDFHEDRSDHSRSKQGRSLQRTPSGISTDTAGLDHPLAHPCRLPSSQQIVARQSGTNEIGLVQDDHPYDVVDDLAWSAGSFADPSVGLQVLSS
jgi:hypothetical protein